MEGFEAIFVDRVNQLGPFFNAFLECSSVLGELLDLAVGLERRVNIPRTDMYTTLIEGGVPPEKTIFFIIDLSKDLERYLEQFLPEKVHCANYDFRRTSIYGGVLCATEVPLY